MPAYKDAERNTWYAAFNVKDWNGKIIRKKKRGFKTKKEALEWEARVKLQKEQVSNLTLNQLYEEYMKVNQKNIRDTTLALRINTYKNHIEPILGNVKIEKITPQMILNWEDTLKNGKNPKNELKINTIRNFRALLSTILNFGIKFYGLSKNPVQRTTKQKGLAVPIHKFWTFNDFQKFINNPNLPEQYRIYFEMLYWTGMRFGELHALTLNDIDLKKGIIIISKTNPGNHYEIHKTKTEAGTRKISLPSFLIDKIEKYINTLFLTEDMLIFPATSAIIRIWMKKTCEAENLPYITIHGLRHSHASLLFNMGYTPLMIKERLGHRDIQTTLSVYTHIFKEQDASLVASLDALGRKENEIITETPIFYPIVCDLTDDYILCSFPNFPNIPIFKVETLKDVMEIGKKTLLQYFLNTEGAGNIKPFSPEKITLKKQTSVILYIPIKAQTDLHSVIKEN